jgi:hypothetical protein
VSQPWNRRTYLNVPSGLYETADNHTDLKVTEVDLFWAIHNYWNGRQHPPDEESLEEGVTPQPQIGLDYPPSLPQLLYAPDEDAVLMHRGTLEDQDSPEYFKQDYLCRSQVDYLLTQAGKEVAQELFVKWYKVQEGEPDLYPGFHGDDKGLLTHHFLVTAAAGVMPSFEKAYGYPDAADLQQYGFPTGTVPDIYYERDAFWDFAVEAWTGNHDYKRAFEKCRTWDIPGVSVLWVFPDAATAARLINTFERSDRINFDFPNAPFSNPDDYRLHRLREHLARPEAHCPGFDDILTATACIEDIPTNSYVPGYGIED